MPPSSASFLHKDVDPLKRCARLATGFTWSGSATRLWRLTATLSTCSSVMINTLHTCFEKKPQKCRGHKQDQMCTDILDGIMRVSNIVMWFSTFVPSSTLSTQTVFTRTLPHVSTPFKKRVFLCVSSIGCHSVVAVHRSVDGFQSVGDIPPNFGRTSFRVDS